MRGRRTSSSGTSSVKSCKVEADKFRGVYNHKPGGRIRLRDVMQEADLRPHISGSTED
jgi:hypothetical protein